MHILNMHLVPSFKRNKTIKTITSMEKHPNGGVVFFQFPFFQKNEEL